ncbi:MAG: hypothetical protein ACM3NQ_06750 [Bacteroidales bacterium]
MKATIQVIGVMVALSDGKLLIRAEGKTFVLGTGETYELLKVNDLDEFALATPALVGDRLLLRTESLLYSIRQTR